MKFKMLSVLYLFFILGTSEANEVNKEASLESLLSAQEIVKISPVTIGNRKIELDAFSSGYLCKALGFTREVSFEVELISGASGAIDFLSVGPSGLFIKKHLDAGVIMLTLLKSITCAK